MPSSKNCSNLGLKISAHLNETFRAWAKAHQYRLRYSIESAIRLFMLTTDEMRYRAITCNLNTVDALAVQNIKVAKSKIKYPDKKVFFNQPINKILADTFKQFKTRINIRDSVAIEGAIRLLIKSNKRVQESIFECEYVTPDNFKLTNFLNGEISPNKLIIRDLSI